MIIGNISRFIVGTVGDTNCHYRQQLHRNNIFLNQLCLCVINLHFNLEEVKSLNPKNLKIVKYGKDLRLSIQIVTNW